MSSRWVEWKVVDSYKKRYVVDLYDGPSGAKLGSVLVDHVVGGLRLHVHLLDGLLSREYDIEVDAKEALRPDHFEPLVDDVEKVLPGLSGDVVTAIFQAINAVKTLNARRGAKR
jgi:hypothetical protein